MAGCGGGERTESAISAPVTCVSSATDPNDLGMRRTRLRLMPEGIEVTWTVSRPELIEDLLFTVALTDQYGAAYADMSFFILGEEWASLTGQEWVAAVKVLRERGEEFVEEPPPLIKGRSLRMIFPRTAVAGITHVTHWRASGGAHVAGEDRDDWCPDPPPGDDLPEPLPLPQPRSQ